MSSADQETQFKFVYASTGCFGMIHHWLMNDNAGRKAMDTTALARLMTQFTSGVRK
ncbi:hypothetical protein [Bifidobacterium choloepi]|uniref:hypothetical protein n=1 Tax=Bifidobacterium choloepi TaxID=2614131 RepID=UPI0013D4D73B|nr:hypothetical protein [Bifidobacterium choloepi]